MCVCVCDLVSRLGVGPRFRSGLQLGSGVRKYIMAMKVLTKVKVLLYACLCKRVISQVKYSF